MRRSRLFISIIGVMGLIAGCGSKTASPPPDAKPEIAATPEQAGSISEPLTEKDFFPDPLVSASTTVQPVPVPNLIPPTASTERVPQVDTGRPDPFASLNYSATVKVKPANNRPAPPIAAPSSPVAALPQPQPMFPLPPLIPAATTAAPLPSISVPAPAVPLKSEAESIEISGVIEVSGKTNVIVKVPTEHTSRYVAVGERLANGNVLIKRVEMGLEPVVILEQGGREIVRSIGSSSALVGAL